MTTIATARPTIPPAPKYLVDDAQLAAAAFLARYSGRTLDAYRLDLRGTSSGPPTTRFRCRTRLAPTSSCTAPGWTNAAWRRQRSTGGSGPCAASTGSPISTGGSARTRPSTSAGRACTPRTSAASAGPNSACSGSPGSSTTATMRRSPCCSGSSGCGSARRAPPTSRTLASNGDTERCASSASAPSAPPAAAAALGHRYANGLDRHCRVQYAFAHA
jgi:hypothetical protein